MLSRKALIGVASLLGVAVVVVGALGILRWQADKAAADYADRAQANLRASTAAAKKDSAVTRATEKVDAATKATKPDAKVDGAKALGPALAALFKASAPLLKVEHAGMPDLKGCAAGFTTECFLSRRGRKVCENRQNV